MNEATPSIDAVTVEIIRNGLLAVTEEMKTNLMRTAYNLIIYEALDFTVGLFTPDGRTVSIGLGLPMFIRGMAEVVGAKLAKYGAGRMHPGDILITNDAYITGSHLNHVTLTQPIFHEGKLIAFACCMAHWLDVGGSIGGQTTEIYQEGLQIPILKYRAGDRVNEDLLEIISLNVRLPSRAMGDLRAQVTAVTSGERRLLELVARYGQAAVEGAIAVIMDQTEALARANTRSIPDGVYEASSFMDDDGVSIGEPVPIHVRVEVRGEEMEIDLSGISPQVGGFFNSGISTGFGLAQVAYKCLTTPTDYPVNDGAFRSLRVIMPPGRVVSAQRPAAMKQWMSFPQTVIDTIFKALAGVIPDRVIAGHHADLVVCTMHGINPADGRFWIGGVGPIGGGWGAKRREDGIGATVCINDGDTHNSPSEQLETKYPVLVESYRLRPNSGGPGRHRGGLGTEIVVQALAPITLDTRIERMHCLPWGLHDGGSGAGNAAGLRRGGVWQENLPNAKLVAARLRRGDAFMLSSGGGGGFGPAFERPVASVLEDVREGYVSPEAARRDYGVVIGDGLAVDEAETSRARQAT